MLSCRKLTVVLGQPEAVRRLANAIYPRRDSSPAELSRGSDIHHNTKHERNQRLCLKIT